MKRRFKLLFTICLISTVFVNASVIFINANAKTEVKKITIEVGQKRKINMWKANNKIKLSKKGIISITKKGKITALKTGTVNVTIKHQKKTKKYKIVVKAKKFEIDFTKVVTMTIRDLVYGYSNELTLEEMEIVKNLFVSTQLKKYSVTSNKIGNGSMKYKICMYNKDGEELYNLNVGTDYVSVHKGDTYLSSEKIDCDVLADLIK